MSVRQRVWFGGVGVDVMDEQQAVARTVALATSAATRGPSVVVTPNVDHLVLYRKDARFRAVYDRAELVLADGMPLVMLAKLLRLPLREKVSGSDFVGPLMAGCAAAGAPVYLFGASDEVTAESAEKLTTAHAGLRIVGRSSPRYNAAPGAGGGPAAGVDANPTIADGLADIAASGAQLVLLAFGAPKQEQLLADFTAQLPNACFVCCGATLDFVAGRVARCPAWMSKYSLEWVYRLYKEPGRLWKRYLVRDTQALPIFARMAISRVRGRALVTDGAWDPTPT